MIPNPQWGADFATEPEMAYIGPSDIVRGASFWFGLRGYSAAYSTGTNTAITIRRVSDNTTENVVILSNGSLDVITAEAFCSGTTCYVSNWKDQTGNGYEASQSGQSSQPQLVFNANGSLPRLLFNSSSSQEFVLAASPSIPGPFSVSTVAQRTANFSSYNDIPYQFSGSSNGVYVGFPNTPSTVFINGNTSLTAPATDNTLHYIQAVLNNGSSANISVDGVVTTGDAGSDPMLNSELIQIGGWFNTSSNYLTGYVMELGMWPIAFSPTEETDLTNNQSAFWTTTNTLTASPAIRLSVVATDTQTDAMTGRLTLSLSTAASGLQTVAASGVTGIALGASAAFVQQQSLSGHGTLILSAQSASGLLMNAAVTLQLSVVIVTQWMDSAGVVPSPTPTLTVDAPIRVIVAPSASRVSTPQ